MRRKGKKSPRQGNQGMSAKLDRAYYLIKRGQHEDAIDLLQKLTRQQPNNVDAWSLLGSAYDELDNPVGMWDAIDHLLALLPDDPISWINAAIVASQNNLLFMTQQYLNHYLETWPDHEKAANVREMKEAIDTVCAEIASEDPTAATVNPEYLVEFERAQMLLNLGRYQEARELSQRVMKKLPDFPPPMNNLSLAYALQGRFDEAINLARQVLEHNPDNVHALSNLTQFLVRTGQREEAQQVAARLREQPPSGSAGWVKLVEALAYLGDDAAICDLYPKLEKSDDAEDIMAYTHHLAAVSFARRGDDKRARQLWKKALKLDDTLEIARENMNDLKKKIGERNGAWPFPFQQWVSQEWIQKFLNIASSQGKKSALKRETLRVLKANPTLEVAIPILLERGDPLGREFAFNIAARAELPALRDYALSPHGPDTQRVKAFNLAVDAGLLPRGKPVPVYVEGKQKEIFGLIYEIHSRTERSNLPKEAQQLMEKGFDLVHENRPEKALPLIEQALEIAPDNATLMNHKAVALGLMGRVKETKAMIRRLGELHPDYFFARCGMAELCAQEGKFDEAHQWLDPLTQNESFHISEYGALCKAHVEVLLAEGLVDGAHSWLNMLEQAVPDSPMIGYLRGRVRRKR